MVALTGHNGYVQDRYTYSPWGVLTSSSEKVPYACGIVTDNMSALLHAGYRDAEDVSEPN